MQKDNMEPIFKKAMNGDCIGAARELLKAAGGDELVEWLKNIGYFEKPASLKGHGSWHGGLFDHSFHVALELQRLTDGMHLNWERPGSPEIIGLLHDVCKCDDYMYDALCSPNPSKYIHSDIRQLPGHGDKSLIMLLGHADLTEEEIMCIRYHMGAFTDREEWEFYTRAVQHYPNVLYTHTADMIAAHIDGI
ncbi:MAG: hypothetical protein LUD50_04585 [Clostridia bacterium]|nr:hypothetical protein [Clostridia bacterium]